MTEELEGTRLACIWHNHQERGNNRLKTIIRERYNDIERQNLFSKTSQKISLVFYQEMKHVWGRE
jgi:hypothetical protein